MAYLALARKYRPQRFADMIGQEHVTRTLENAIKSDRVHHAYLFCGVRGLGKTTAARILAKCLVCEQGPTPEPCNVCVQCVAVNEGRSVDVLEIDGASNNSVDDIRSLREQVAYLPHSARRKIYLIDEVHMLSASAFNALLKTLEEPPPHVTFMFATTEPHKVLATILSRVSRLDYRTVRAATLVPYLEQICTKEGVSVETEGLTVVARCGEGSVRDSLTLLDKVIAFAEDPNAISTQEVLTVLGQASRYVLAQLVQTILDRDAQALLARFETITANGIDLMRLGVGVLQHLRDLTVIALTGSRGALLEMNDDLYEELVAQAQSVDARLLAQHFDRFTRVVDSLKESRAPHLAMEMGLLELVEAEPLIPLGDIITRLDAISGGGTGGGGRSGGGGRKPQQPRRRAAPAQPPAAARFQPAPETAAPETAAPVQAVPETAAPETAAPVQAAPVQAAPVRPAPTRKTDSHIDALEQMARDAGLLPGGPMKGPSPAVSSPATPAAAPPVSSEFELTNAELTPSTEPQSPDGSCPGTRCPPQESIPWRELKMWDAWESFLDRIRAQNDLLWAVLLDMGLVELREGAVVLAAPAAGFAQAQLRENPELKLAFESSTAVYFGEVMHLELIDAAPSLPDTPSLNLVDAQRNDRHRAAVAQDAAGHPRIRALLHTFSAQLRRVEPLAGPSLPPVGSRGPPQA